MNTKSSIQIGVVMAVYNASETLKSAIESVRNQSYSNWIMVCVDDGSTDNSFDILQEYSLQDSRITVLVRKMVGRHQPGLWLMSLSRHPIL